MKRYRVFAGDFDSRSLHLATIIDEKWEDDVKKLHNQNREIIINGLKNQYGESNLEDKINNFINLGSKHMSVIAYHNRFLEQIRNSYVIGSYYPALTGACALGERILNHLLLALRKYHKDSNIYKRIYNKDSIDNWLLLIDALEQWGEILPEAVAEFKKLLEIRNNAIHFNPKTDRYDKKMALDAIHLIQEIISIQFGAFGKQPWYFISPGECYVRKEWEDRPFVKHIILPNCALVGYMHKIESVVPQIVINDQFEYEDKEITDGEFINLRSSNKIL